MALGSEGKRYVGRAVGGPLSGVQIVWDRPSYTMFPSPGPATRFDPNDTATHSTKVAPIGVYSYDPHFGQWYWKDFGQSSGQNVNNQLPFQAPDLMGDIAEFHNKFGLGYDGPPRDLSGMMALFRVGFMAEELCEFVDMSPDRKHQVIQMMKNDYVHGGLEKKLDALVDLVYVAIGTAYLYGFDFREAWRRVHAANMQKVRSERKDEDSSRGSSFDVVKPPGWKPASLTDLAQTSDGKNEH